MRLQSPAAASEQMSIASVSLIVMLRVVFRSLHASARYQPPATAGQVVSINRKAQRDVEVEQQLEVGLSLTASEVKSLRKNRVDLTGSYAAFEDDGRLLLRDMTIPLTTGKQLQPHEPKRPRPVLAHRSQLKKLRKETARRGVTLVPLSIYFARSGFAKVDLALASGRKRHHKKQRDKERSLEAKEARSKAYQDWGDY
eukprot:PLAT16105.2.p1 GENE.PLAT16105.2~~PLAT16105.2.p1  ORF type:complete len:198 (+),score=50.01 PLAT16105.2:723-1316(+)